jgi:aminoglycoside phosphotransferase (APT) family kinase protein
MVDSLADLAAVDWRDRGLDGLGRPEGFLDRQVGRWLGQLERYRTREIKHLDAVAEWLEANRPRTGPVGLMHGDYSPFNVMASPDDPHRLAAVIDWDTGTIGDPLLDLGHLLARWTEPGEAPALSYPIDIAQRDGLPTRAALAERYAARTGFDLSALRFYETLALFKLAIILEGSVSRAFSALRPDAHRQASRVDRLIACAAQFANGERT